MPSLFPDPTPGSQVQRRQEHGPVHAGLMLSGASHAALVPDCNVRLSVCPSTAPRTVLSAADISVSLLNEGEKENKACGHYRQPQPLGLRNSGTKLKKKSLNYKYNVLQ